MNRLLVKKHFGVNLRSGEPLREQLQARLETFIANCEIGTRIPPERLLEEIIGVSRITIRNALQPLYKNGLISRQGRKGTFVLAKAPAAPAKFHDMAFGMPWVHNTTTTLKLLTYENLPQQQFYWEKVTALFNKTRKNAKIELLWLPLDADIGNLSSYLEKNSVDIFMYSTIYPEKISALASPLPPQLGSFFADPDYIAGILPHGETDLFNYVVPINLSLPMTFWNEALAEKYELPNVRERIRKGELLDMIAEVAPRLPEGFMAADHIWDYVNFCGLAQQNGSLDRVYLLDLMEKMLSVADSGKSFFTRQHHSREAVENFVVGRQLFLNTNIPVLQSCAKPGFSLSGEPFPFQIPNLIYWSGLAITKGCSSVDSAQDFLTFLLSKSAQKLIVDKKKMPPILLSAFKAFAKINYLYEEKNIRKFLRTSIICANPGGVQEQLSYFCTFCIREELHALLSRELSPQDAADNIINKWQDNKRRLSWKNNL
jgi:DNA-binding transcriptional regulator YhcF (GntR family)